MRQIFFGFLLFVSTIPLFAQTTQKYDSPYADFYKAEDLYEKGQFGSARMMFHQFMENTANTNDPFYIKAAYYEALSALELFHNDAIPLLEDFNKNYPENIYRNEIYFRIGRYYYQKNKFKTAVDWLTKINKFNIDSTERDEYNFKLGHSYYNTGDMDQAVVYFANVKDSASQYYGPSLYFFSHISYEQKHYQTALEGFQKLQSDPRFGKIVPYYIAQIYYLLGNYKKVTELAKNMSDENLPNNVSDMNQIIGDSYYQTGDYKQAVHYLSKYNSKHKTTRDEDYQLADAYFKARDYQHAIQQYNKVATKDDSLSQIVYYNMAVSYLKNNDLLGARNAFERVAQLKFNPKINEDALYNFAVLSYKIDVNPYDEALKALHQYLETYPNSDRKDEVYNCLVSVYTMTHRYQDALNDLDQSKLTDVRLKNAYQVVAYNLGVQKFQNKDYEGAIATFLLVNKYPIDQLIINKSYFWTADAYYRMGDYAKAINYYESFINFPGDITSSLRNDVFYNLGYCYLKTKQYDKEQQAFTNYVEKNSEVKNVDKLFDAYLRLGDLSYVLKQNDDAINYYKKTLTFSNTQKDHALYFMALTYGLKGNFDTEKIKALNQLIKNYPKSPYYLSSLYELGITNRTLKNDDEALKYFNQIITNYPKSNYNLPAKLSRAGIYLDQRQYQKAEAEYKQLAKDYPSDMEVCQRAYEGLKDIYVAQNQIDKISSLSNMPCAKDIQNEIENTYYDNVTKYYFVTDTNYVESIKAINTYLTKFPNGKYATELESYLGNCYAATDDETKSIEAYEKVLQAPKSGFTEQAASIVSRYYYNSGDNQKALQYYQQLDDAAVNVSSKFQAEVGLMRTNFILKNYQDAADAAQRVIANSLQTKEILLEAKYVAGVAAFNLKNYDQAVEPLQYVVENAKNSTANESKFYLAQIAFDNGKWDDAETTIRELLKIKPAYDYWTAKGLILQTKVMMQKNDLFNAEETINSVIVNYQVKDDGILDEANQVKADLLALKNKPKEIMPNPDNVIELDENHGK